MSDFESGAFNRALPTLRNVYNNLRDALGSDFVLGVRFGVPSISSRHQPIDGRRLMLRSEMAVTHHHLKRPMPSSSATVRRSTPAITSLLANVCRLQCQLYPSIAASFKAVGNHPREPCKAPPLQAEGNTGSFIRGSDRAFAPEPPQQPS